MIVTALLKLVYWIVVVLTAPLRLLPDATLPSGVASALTSSKSYLYALDGFIPVSTIAAVILAFLTVEGFILTYKAIMWGIKKIPTIN